MIAARLMLATLGLLALTRTVSAECAWVLWEGVTLLPAWTACMSSRGW